MLVNTHGHLDFNDFIADRRNILARARKCPLHQLLLEGDTPFWAPKLKRSKRNEPAFLIHTAERIALLKKLPLELLARQTTLNARGLYHLPDPTGALT